MKFLRKAKDGGPESKVTGYWLIEIKSLFTIVLLRFDHGSRESYHSHAFNALGWILNKGQLREEHLDGRIVEYQRSFRPIVALKSTFHRVFSNGTTWVFSVRGPWSKTWAEYDPKTNQTIRLSHGRKVEHVAFK